MLCNLVVKRYIYNIVIIEKTLTGSTKTRQRALTRNALQPCYETMYNNIIIINTIVTLLTQKTRQRGILIDALL